MIEVVMWFMLIFSFVGVLVFGFLTVTALRAVTKMMDRLEELEEDLMVFNQRKQDRPQPPPNVVPLERM